MRSNGVETLALLKELRALTANAEGAQRCRYLWRCKQWRG